MKTIKQIADDLNVSKQQVYRYIKKNNIKESHQEAGTMYYDETAVSFIKQAFEEKKQHQEAPQDNITASLVESLQKELQVKNQQIETLTATIENLTNALTASQALQANTERKLLSMEENAAEERQQRSWRGFWRRKKKGEKDDL